MVQEGTRPYEDPNALLLEAASVIDELEKLVVAINAANSSNKRPTGRTLTSAIAHRGSQIQRHSLLQAAIGATQKEPDRYSMREIKWNAAIDLSKLQKQSEDLARQLRELNAKIQESNWKIDV